MTDLVARRSVHNGHPTREECHKAVIMTLANHEVGGRWVHMFALINELTALLQQWTERAYRHGVDDGLSGTAARQLAAVADAAGLLMPALPPAPPRGN